MNTPSDEKIINAFLDGSVKGLIEHDISAEHIQTQISHIFLYKTTAYKFYRRDNEGFNKSFVNLGDEATRTKFYEEDFFYNHYFNPDVYQQLQKIKIARDKVELKNKEDVGDDWIIQMRRIDTTRNLTALLLAGKLKIDDFRKIGFQMTKAVAEFPHKPKTAKNCYEIMKIYLKDVENFAYLAEPLIRKEDTRRVMERLNLYLDGKKDRFANLQEKDFVSSIDNHSDNVFYEDNRVSFIDIFPPKEDWRIVEPLYVIYRLSADVEVLAGKEYADALIDGHKEYYKIKETGDDIRLFYQLYAAMIKGAYLYMLSMERGKRADEAKRYLEFVEANINKI
jgi:aminoglycoside phosphotransferase family enzyme